MMPYKANKRNKSKNQATNYIAPKSRICRRGNMPVFACVCVCVYI